jgi:hypothetical protein
MKFAASINQARHYAQGIFKLLSVCSRRRPAREGADTLEMRGRFRTESKNKKAIPGQIEFAWSGCTSRRGRFRPSRHRICPGFPSKSAYRIQFSSCPLTVRVMQPESQNRSVKLVSASRQERNLRQILRLECNDRSLTGMSRACSEVELRGFQAWMLFGKTCDSVYGCC